MKIISTFAVPFEIQRDFLRPSPKGCSESRKPGRRHSRLDRESQKFIEKTERKYKQVPEVVTTISNNTSVSFFIETHLQSHFCREQGGRTSRTAATLGL